MRSERVWDKDLGVRKCQELKELLGTTVVVSHKAMYWSARLVASSDQRNVANFLKGLDHR